MARTIPPGLAFGVDEYEARLDATRESMARRGIDVLLVTSPANLCYLTGYVASWYAPKLPIGAVIHREEPDVVLVDWSRHREFAPLLALHDAFLQVDYGTAAGELAAGLRERGWADGVVGVERVAENPTPAILRGVEIALAEAGAEVVAGDWLVDDLRTFKSPAEMERVRAAGEIVDGVFEAIGEFLRPGATELEIAARMTTLLAEGGSEVPAQHPLVSSGPAAWSEVHGFPSRRALERGDIVSLDASAVVDRYHVNLSRTFSLGAPGPRAARYQEVAADALEALLATARVGEAPAGALEAATRVVEERVPAEDIWWVGGYQLGIAFPPSWVGHTYLNGDGPTSVTLQPGLVSNFETILFNRDEGFESAAIDTIVVDDAGVHALSRIPRALIQL